ncbi:S8 family serine peptidase [Clostridium sp. ZBS12]|uniref:S8 family serine peptidase n=1 Tax=Clostridium sp. ZBS12 TaxID=2949972 RepID=UPI00207AB7BF|nr:S8 family serine peptidase [Clostridium sp. ZBS12]
MYNTVILIDSGIDTNLYKKNIVGGICFSYESGKVTKSSNYFDKNGHGTACACVISSISKDTNFYVIKVLNNKAKTSMELLIAALEYCSTLKYKIINLSLATIDSSNIHDLKKICEKLKDQGKLIISSVFNRHTTSYPASFDSVLGVRGGILSEDDSFWFNPKYEIECVANIIPQFTKRSLNNYMLFGGNSKACAYMSGYIMNIIKDTNICEIDKIKSILQKCSTKYQWREDDINTSITWPFFKYDSERTYAKSQLERIKTSLYKVNPASAISYLGWNDNLYEKKIVTPNNCKAIIENLEEEYNSRINDNYINFFSFFTVKSLLELVREEKNKNGKKFEINKRDVPAYKGL